MKPKITILIATILLSSYLSSVQAITDTVSIENLYDNWYFTKKVSFNENKCIILIENHNFVAFRDTVDLVNKNRVFVDWCGNGYVSIVYSCGTYCWSNKIIELSTGIVYNWTYITYDLTTLNLVNVIDNCFIIYNLKDRTIKTLEIPEYYCIEGIPFFKIFNLSINNNSIEYNVDCKNDKKLFNKIYF